MKLKVVKIGGAALSDARWLSDFARAAAASTEPLVIVHGGGPDISELSARLGIEVEWYEGRRVTPPPALDVASMVLNGRINKRIVAVLQVEGVDALGLSGVDGGLIRATVVEGGAVGCVGRVEAVRTSLLDALVAHGHTVVVSPISLGPSGELLNVNADDAAAAIADAMSATELVFITDVDGVRDGGIVRPHLDPDQARGLVRSGVASGGMGVKLAAAVKALDGGVAAVRIGNSTVLFDDAAGTMLRPVTLGVA